MWIRNKIKRLCEKGQFTIGWLLQQVMDDGNHLNSPEVVVLTLPTYKQPQKRWASLLCKEIQVNGSVFTWFFIVTYATLKGINELHTDSYCPSWKQVPCFTVGVLLKYEAMDVRLMSDVFNRIYVDILLTLNWQCRPCRKRNGQNWTPEVTSL